MHACLPTKCRSNCSREWLAFLKCSLHFRTVRTLEVDN